MQQRPVTSPAANEGLIVGRPVRDAVLRLIRGMDLRLHPRSVAPAEGPKKCGPRRPTRSGYSCNNALRVYIEALAKECDRFEYALKGWDRE